MPKIRRHLVGTVGVDRVHRLREATVILFTPSPSHGERLQYLRYLASLQVLGLCIHDLRDILAPSKPSSRKRDALFAALRKHPSPMMLNPLHNDAWFKESYGITLAAFAALLRRVQAPLATHALRGLPPQLMPKVALHRLRHGKAALYAA